MLQLSIIASDKRETAGIQDLNDCVCVSVFVEKLRRICFMAQACFVSEPKTCGFIGADNRTPKSRHTQSNHTITHTHTHTQISLLVYAI